ncbi:MAG: hypothetical protein IKY16_06580 [Bacteroidales bacterium]|nr:hypothetical protein [Bacteroidales bacterium]
MEDIINEKKCFPVYTLPYIEMYGGETLSWEISLLREDGTKYSADSVEACRVILTFMPVKTTTGLGYYAKPADPVLEKMGDTVLDTDGSPITVFTFSEEDTIALRGKYIYQIEVRHNDDLRVCQGDIYIKQNINR